MIHPSKLLKQYNLHASKKLGQNFLINTHSLEKSEKLFPHGSQLLEIGPGLGAVTDYFLSQGFQMTCIEKDEKMFSFLENNFLPNAQQEYGIDSLKLVYQDFLKVPDDYFQKNNIFHVIGNLPFYITSPIIIKILKNTAIKSMFIGVQKEVGQRISTSHGNSLTILLQYIGKGYTFSDISRNSFHPIPDVNGCWFYWKRHDLVQSIENIETMELLLRACFWGKRKTIRNCLKNNPHFKGNPLGKEWLDILKNEDVYPIEHLLNKRADALMLKDFQTLIEFFFEKFRSWSDSMPI